MLEKTKGFDLSLLSRYRTELMGVGTIAILLCHASGRGVVLPSILEWLFGFGNIGVDIFLFLSGMGMYYSLHKQDSPTTGAWLRKRLFRVLLPYTIISVPIWIYYCVVNSRDVIDFFYYYSTVSFWTKHFGAWYVALLIPLYIITPLMGKAIDICRYRWLPISIIAILLALGGAANGEATTYDSVIKNIQFVVCRIPCFVFGYGLAPAVKVAKRLPWISAPAMLITYFACGRLPFLRDINFNLLLALPTMMLACVLLKKLTGLCRPLKWLGEISLESYLANVYLGYLFGTFTWTIGGADINRRGYFSYACVVIFGILLAYAVNRLCDRFKCPRCGN